MAAPSPRKSQRSRARHHKDATRAHWLAVGAVGAGLATALVTGQGVAAAETEDSTSTHEDRGDGETGGSGENAVGGAAGSADGSGADDGGSGVSGADESEDVEGDFTEDDLTDELDDAFDSVDETDDDEGDVPDVDDELPPNTDGSAQQRDPGLDDDARETTSATTESVGQSLSGRSSPPSQEPTAADSIDPADAESLGTEGDAVAATTTVLLAGGSVPEESAREEGAPEEIPAEGEASLEEVEIPPEYREAAEATILMVRELLRQLGVTGGNSAPTTPFGIVMQALWVSSRRYQDPWNMTVGAVRIIVETVVEATLADLSKTVGWIPGVGTLLYGASALYDAADLVIALTRWELDDVVDEIQDLARDFVGMIPIVGAPLAGSMINQPAVASLVRIGSVLASLGAASVVEPPALMAARVAEMTETAIMAAAAVPQPGTAEWYFVGTLDRAVKRLGRWLPGIPKNFTDFTTTTTDFTLDALNNQLDNIVATALPGSPARWVPDLLSVLGMFVTSAIPGYTFSDTLNVWGDFLNRVAPPFEIAQGADTLGIITPYKMMGAAVVGAATVLKAMLNGVYDPVQIEIDVIKATTGATVTASDLNNFTALLAAVAAAQTTAMLGLGDGGAFHEPERAWNITLPTWTEAQTNPFTLAVYVGVVAVYKRFQEMAVFTHFDIWTTYSPHLIYGTYNYTESLFGIEGTYSQFAGGTFHAVDDIGRPVDFSLLGIYASEGGASVTVTEGGGFSYTNLTPGTEFFHRYYSENPEDRYDVVYVPVTSADGVAYNLPFKIDILPGDGQNHNPTTSATTIGTADALGVVRGKINASDSDGDTLTYRLVESSVNGLSGNSAYTKAGAGNGGIVTINPTTGDFTYISSATAGATQSFQVEVSDGHYGRVYVTVTVPNSPVLTPADVSKPANYIYSGTVPIPPADVGLFTGFALGANPAKGTVTSFDPVTGAFTYVRDSSLGHSTIVEDVVTILATDANGRTVTLQLTVKPDVPNSAPSLVLTTAPTVGTLAGTTQTSTGKLTFSDPDGDSPIWPTSVTSARGGTVTIAPDGSFTYTLNMSTAQRHAIAKIGAAGTTYNGVALTAYQDVFTVTVEDGFNGSATLTVVVPIYAVNSSPTLDVGLMVCTATVCTVTITTTDPDGDDLSGSLNTSNNGSGAPWYTLDRGSVTVNLGDSHTMSWGGNTDGLGFLQTGIQRYTVYDGHYRVVNGVVDTAYFSRAWVQWNDTTMTTGT
ncbi:Ig-like domain-containing protein [Mycolicibacterium phlei]